MIACKPRTSRKRKSKPSEFASPHEESFIESCRRRVIEQYGKTRLSSGSVGGCFGSILCSELHYGRDGNGMHFIALANKWGIPVTVLGELIWDHCKRLEDQLQVNHKYGPE